MGRAWIRVCENINCCIEGIDQQATRYEADDPPYYQEGDVRGDTKCRKITLYAEHKSTKSKDQTDKSWPEKIRQSSRKAPYEEKQGVAEMRDERRSQCISLRREEYNRKKRCKRARARTD